MESRKFEIKRNNWGLLSRRLALALGSMGGIAEDVAWKPFKHFPESNYFGGSIEEVEYNINRWLGENWIPIPDLRVVDKESIIYTARFLPVWDKNQPGYHRSLHGRRAHLKEIDPHIGPFWDRSYVHIRIRPYQESRRGELGRS